MKRIQGGKLSPRTNKILLIINIVLFLGAVVLAILNLDLKEYTSAVAMLFVGMISGANIFGCWNRLKGQVK